VIGIQVLGWNVFITRSAYSGKHQYAGWEWFLFCRFERNEIDNWVNEADDLDLMTINLLYFDLSW